VFARAGSAIGERGGKKKGRNRPVRGANPLTRKGRGKKKSNRQLLLRIILVGEKKKKKKKGGLSAILPLYSHKV